jgi:uncharacterized protein (DUF1800 family)
MAKSPLPPLDKLDPGKVWQPWEPTDQDPFNLKWAGHLYRRAGFGANLPQLRAAVKEGLQATFAKVVQREPNPEESYRFYNTTGEAIARGNNPFQLRGWWVYTLVYTPQPLLEKMVLFWHNHFATSIAKVGRTTLMYRQNQLIRKHALGKFEPFLLEMSKDPAMLIWLDSNSNLKGAPNENYAREVMELFSLGVGNYKEHDIREAARAFTGWHTNGEEFEFNARVHDDGEKVVFGHEGNLDGGDVVRLLLQQPACARFLVRKLYRYFISEAQDPPAALLEPLAERLRKSAYDVGDLVRTMLLSRHFFSEHAYRARIKSPVEFVLGAASAVGQKLVAPQALVSKMDAMGQSLFAPPNVKGWEGGKNWLNTATVLARHNFAQTLTSGTGQLNLGDPTAPIAVAIDPAAIIRREKLTEPEQIVALLIDLLLDGQVRDEARQRLQSFVAEGRPQGSNLDQRVRETIHSIMTMPEYQLS